MIGMLHVKDYAKIEYFTEVTCACCTINVKCRRSLKTNYSKHKRASGFMNSENVSKTLEIELLAGEGDIHHGLNLPHPKF